MRHFAAGLSMLGIEARSHLAICSPNRLEWCVGRPSLSLYSGPLVQVCLSQISLHVDTIIRYLADFACVYRSVISVALHTNSNRSDMLFILKRVQVHRTMPNRHCIDDCVWLTDWPMLFFFQATCIVCSPEFVKLFEELAPSLPTLQYIIHFDKDQPSLPDGDSLSAPAALGTDRQQHQVSLSLSPQIFWLLCCLIRQASGADWGQDTAVQ